jgi:hydroxyethylthiazole kinase-like uncharacterized protein yjeF
VSPIPVLAPDELRAVEARALAAGGPSLMERAGRAAAECARGMAADTGAAIVVVAGPGNNGGDAWVAAASLLRSFHRVVVFDATGAPPKAEEAQAAKSGFLSRGGKVVSEWPAGQRPALVIDGLLGLGLARDVDAGFAAIIERINGSGAPVLALDIPSGLDSRTGRIRASAVRATRTLTFIARKVGLYTADGPDCCGTIECDDLGTDAEVRGAARGSLLTLEAIAPWSPRRKRNSHKGDFGTLAVIGGNRGMVGAALLCARAGLLAGAGKVFVGLLAPDAPSSDLLHPELMLRSVDDALAADVIVAGPGAGQSPSATSVSMFERNVMPALLHGRHPLVLDADALNAIAYNEALAQAVATRTHAPTILTPHPAEAARLLGETTAQVQDDRLSAALDLARRFRAHVVLKGAGSICAFPDGRWSVNSTGNPGLAAPGSGDVLAGLIGALLCQGLEPEHALQYGVCLHGAAGDRCVAQGAGPIGLTASEIALQARAIVNELSSRHG